MPGPHDSRFDDKASTTPATDTPGEKTTPYHGTPLTEATRAPSPADEASLDDLKERYEIIEELGRGGMGLVYRARDRETGDTVALKVLQPHIASDPQMMEHFRSELLLARKVTHKNVCRVHDLVRLGNTAAISMEYVEGESLRRLLRRVDGLSVRHGLKLMAEILSGLGEAHAQGVVHRDLKPENIHIARDSHAKVMDFGIARLMSSATKTRAVSGTPAYMSPEQAQGKPADVRSDIYSLGLLMYELFTGRAAFRADTSEALLQKIVHEEPVPPREADPYLPAFLDRTIRKCLEKDPQKRFQSVPDLQRALGDMPEAPRTPEGEVVLPPRLTGWERADNFLLAAGIIGLLMCLGMGLDVFPANKLRLEVDAITARREAEAAAQRLGQTFPQYPRMVLQYRGQDYAALIFFNLNSREVEKRDKVLALADFPIAWRVSFSESPSLLGAILMGRPFSSRLFSGEGHAVLDRNGKVIELIFPAPKDIPPAYKPPEAEVRRELARSTAEKICGPLPAAVTMVETSGGYRGLSYSAAWPFRRKPDGRPWAEVVFLAEKPARVSCEPRAEFIVDIKEFTQLLTIFEGLCLLSFLWFFGVTLFHLIATQSYQSRLLWKRAPIAIPAGLAGAWVLAPGFSELTTSLPILLLGGVAVGALLLLCMVHMEELLARHLPQTIAGYKLMMQGAINPVVGLSILRGTLGGLVLLALVLWAERLSLTASFTSHGLNQVPLFMLRLFFSPAPIGHALSSSWPALFVVASVLFHMVFLGLIMLGLNMRDVAKLRQRLKPAKGIRRVLNEWLLAMTSGGALFYATFVFPLHLAQSFGVGTVFLGLFLFSALWGWLALRYDVLTVTVAVGTVVLFSVNYPLLHILSNTGNGPQWAIFIGWGALVLAAAVVTFGPQVRKARQELVESFK